MVYFTVISDFQIKGVSVSRSSLRSTSPRRRPDWPGQTDDQLSEEGFRRGGLRKAARHARARPHCLHHCHEVNNSLLEFFLLRFCFENL